MTGMGMKLKPLDHGDRIHLNAAEGWLGLGDVESANGELDEISTGSKVHPAVLLMRSSIYQAAKKWDYVISISETLVRQLPKLSEAWIHRSFALHELKRTQEAYDLLVPATEKFPKLWVIPYNLACYACQLGNGKESLPWLEKAIDLAGKKEIRAMALDDADLEPLWNQIGEI